VPAFPSPTLSEPFDPAPQRERMRGVLAAALVVLLIAEVGFAFYLISDGKADALRDVFSLVFGATTTLIGTAIGFYFGQMSASPDA
jgi:hypothetical protein